MAGRRHFHRHLRGDLPSMAQLHPGGQGHLAVVSVSDPDGEVRTAKGTPQTWRPEGALQVGGEPVRHLGPGLEGVVGQAVAAVRVEHELGAGRLAGQAFGVIGRH
jgi:hypothetical protein